jgi:hypothetical protein
MGKLKPGQYLVLEFDFSRVTRTPKIAEFVEFLRGEINHGLSEFKLKYTKDLGESFASATSAFRENDPVGNLRELIGAVDHALEDIQESGDEDHPLWDVQGVSLFQTTTHHNTS